MARLIDTSLWIDLTRTKSPQFLKAFIAPFVMDPEASLAEPVVFELTRLATDAELKVLIAYFATMPKLAAPSDLWVKAADLGRDCRKNGHTPGSLDLLISQVAIHHDAELVTFDRDYLDIASASTLCVKYLQRPTA